MSNTATTVTAPAPRYQVFEITKHGLPVYAVIDTVERKAVSTWNHRGMADYMADALNKQ